MCRVVEDLQSVACAADSQPRAAGILAPRRAKHGCALIRPVVALLARVRGSCANLPWEARPSMVPPTRRLHAVKASCR